MSRQIGTALGVSFFGALMTSRIPVLADGSSDPAAYADALRLVFIAVIPIALIGPVISLFLDDITLSRS